MAPNRVAHPFSLPLEALRGTLVHGTGERTICYFFTSFSAACRNKSNNLFVYLFFFLLFIYVFGTLSVMVHFQTIHQQSQYVNYVFLLPEDGVGVGTKKQNMDIMINLYLKVITLRKPVVYLREALTSWSYSVVGT